MRNWKLKLIGFMCTFFTLLLIVGCASDDFYYKYGADKDPKHGDFSYRIRKDRTVKITGYSQKGPANVVIPNKIMGMPVTEIGEGTFYLQAFRSYLQTVEIPETVKIIADGAFEGAGLTEIILPANLEYIGKEAFNSNNLEKISIPNSVGEIGNYAFRSNKLTELNLGHGVKTIGEWAFSGNSLTTVSIPNSVTTIGGSAFSENKISQLKLPENLSRIEDGAIYQFGSAGIPSPKGAFSDNELTTVDLPENLAYIGDYAFANNKITDITFPEATKTIGSGAFYGNKLTRLTIPESVIEIKDGGSVSPERIREINSIRVSGKAVGGKMEPITGLLGYGAFANNQLTQVNIPGTIRQVGDYAFANNELTTVNIGEGVCYLGRYAFYNNNISTISLPKTIIGLFNHVFAENQLTNVIVPDNINITQVGKNAFANNPIISISLPGNINLGEDGFSKMFSLIYNYSGKLAGTYSRSDPLLDDWYLNGKSMSYSMVKLSDTIYVDTIDGNSPGKSIIQKGKKIMTSEGSREVASTILLPSGMHSIEVGYIKPTGGGSYKYSADTVEIIKYLFEGGSYTIGAKVSGNIIHFNVNQVDD
ncbi:MAG: leucine-rich repeat domain-containing protein [Spirochaetaceae bacterium]|jgi:hypothetical protein|nr:leucine-rich repeat domain-containing protein [Spirochaetaceae bacterium]